MEVGLTLSSARAEMNFLIVFIVLFVAFLGLVLTLFFFKTKDDKKRWNNLSSTVEEKNREYMKISRKQIIRAATLG